MPIGRVNNNNINVTVINIYIKPHILKKLFYNTSYDGLNAIKLLAIIGVGNSLSQTRNTPF